MEFIALLIDFILHIDKHLVEIIQNYGTWTYLILFLIIFSETGFVVTPFLPGDSLLFAIGALGAKGALDFKSALVLLILAAVGGNTLNYFIGKTIGHKILAMRNSRIIKKEYLNKTHAFYQKHGGKAIILSRFVPIIRTFAPFVAGLGKMSFTRYSVYNVIGGVSWVCLFMFAGYFIGNIDEVKNNFTYVIFAIIFVSLLPTIVPYLQSKRRR
ncbi:MULTISPECIES: DedA family protein [Desulfosporosinus]|uniref:Membrane-associated protein n=1 Tax=Desulfosporosinus lacus DSM 15449 TaxID=1121420 RepID=A0A1M5YLQ1_9FIRM|nr:MULTISPECIES: DedA family protein [Desulfosporosinus]MCO5386388.1 DedA family protein [Desulfosporosinus sp.]MDA8223010.1 DedA family protein [Desulfitobacterium hafniense]SHI12942.1 membrane-associated protein [Desulfosporosinus lacus DSM 15449]